MGTKSIQEKLLMLSQSKELIAPKENFAASRNRSPSKDQNKNANMVPLARKDKNHVMRLSRPRSRSRNANHIGRLRTRSRSENRISDKREQKRLRSRSRSENKISDRREINRRSPARTVRSPLAKKK